MRRRTWLAVFLLGLAAMGAYVPFERVERVYAVVPVGRPGFGIVSMGRTDELREVRTASAGYAWAGSRPAETGFFGTEVDVRVDWARLGLQAAGWSAVVLAAAVGVGRRNARARPRAEPPDDARST